MPREQIVFSVQLGRTVSPETWTKFLERVRATGRTPLEAIRGFQTEASPSNLHLSETQEALHPFSFRTSDIGQPPIRGGSVRCLIDRVRA